MTPTRARQRPEPAGEPAPETIDPPAIPVEDVPEHAAPAPEPQLPKRDLATILAAFDAGGPEALRPGELDLLLAAETTPTRAQLDEVLDAGPRTTIREQVTEGNLGVGALLGEDADEPYVPVFGSNPAHSFAPGSAMLGGDRTPDDDLVDDHPLSAAEALAEVLRRVQPIEKARRASASAGGYAFRGIDDVYGALHDLFGEVGLVMLPRVIDREREQRPRASGEGVNYVTHLHVEFRFLAADGTSETASAWGEGADTGDKSTGKAHSQAVKSALLAVFLIPTEASSDDDPDATNSAPSHPWTPEEQARARVALDAGREAQTLDALAGVGRRANSGGLLDVPVVGEDGALAPLRLHLDSLRRQLESKVSSHG
jgi:hypothetical protein